MIVDWAATAEMITAVGTVLTAVAWPVTILVAGWYFRSEIKGLATKVPVLLDRVEKLSWGEIEASLKKVEAEATSDVGAHPGPVTPLEVRTAAQIEREALDVASPELSSRLDRLGREYDFIRRTMPSSAQRTRLMTGVLVQMRALGPAVASQIEAFKTSGSPGSRLAAIAIMQMRPELADLDWLQSRFDTEHPFVFYHAALAIQNVANEADEAGMAAVRSVAKTALSTVQSYEGPPDLGTVEVLASILRMPR
jgi:hypothetical protein